MLQANPNKTGTTGGGGGGVSAAPSLDNGAPQPPSEYGWLRMSPSVSLPSSSQQQHQQQQHEVSTTTESGCSTPPPSTTTGVRNSSNGIDSHHNNNNPLPPPPQPLRRPPSFGVPQPQKQHNAMATPPTPREQIPMMPVPMPVLMPVPVPVQLPMNGNARVSGGRNNNNNNLLVPGQWTGDSGQVESPNMGPGPGGTGNGFGNAHQPRQGIPQNVVNKQTPLLASSSSALSTPLGSAVANPEVELRASEEDYNNVALSVAPLFERVWCHEPGIPEEHFFAPKHPPWDFDISKIPRNKLVGDMILGSIELWGDDYLIAVRRTQFSAPPVHMRLILNSTMVKGTETVYELLLFEWNPQERRFFNTGVSYLLPKATVKTAPTYSPDHTPVPLPQADHTPDSVWILMAQGSRYVPWVKVIQCMKHLFAVDLTSWTQLKVSDHGECLSQARWLQICSFLSSTASFQPEQQTIDDLAIPQNFGFFGRPGCETHLVRSGIAKGFLVRFSDTTPGMCAGSLFTGQGVLHLRIMRRWPGDTGIWLDFTGEAKYRSIGNVNHVGWYVVQKEHEDFSTALKATTLKSLVEVSIVKFFDATLLTRPW